MILVTGATGFVGAALVARLHERKYPLSLAVRHDRGRLPPDARVVELGDFVPDTDWRAALADVDCVVHAAARVHVMDEQSADPLAEFRLANVEATLSLARQAAAAGVRRFVFISSIKVNGEATPSGRPFHADDRPRPSDPYGVSKHEAETGLRELATQTGMDVVIVRPPLVYGPGVKANFLAMMRWLHRGIPLPLAAIDNKRSFVALDNLVDLLLSCIEHPAAANQTFLVSDGEDLSTSELLRRLAHALGTPARLLPVPTWLLEAVATLAGKRDRVRRLCGNLQVDIAKTRDVLDWSPPVSIEEALRATARHYLGGVRR